MPNPPLTEFSFIRRHLARSQPSDPDLLLGIGDDAAIIRPRAGFDLCFSSDMLLAGRHFFPHDPPEAIAHKILATNISDIAAMGGQPRWVLLSAALPELNEAWLQAFSGCLFAILRQYGITLIGGDTTRGNLAFNVAITGELPAGKALRRSGAQHGDDIWVSGQIGSAATALHHIWGNIKLPEHLFAPCEAARLRPTPRVALGQAILPLATAAQDISDGLAQDLGHILAASNAGAEIHAHAIPTLPELRQALPEHIVHELTLAGGDLPDAFLGMGIGKINHSGSLKILNAQGNEIHLPRAGFDHFAQS